MKIKELIALLQEQNPEAEVLIGVHNNPQENIPTYAIVDYTYNINNDGIMNDVMPTPGEIDERILKIKTDFVFIGSKFGW